MPQETIEKGSFFRGFLSLMLTDLTFCDLASSLRFGHFHTVPKSAAQICFLYSSRVGPDQRDRSRLGSLAHAFTEQLVHIERSGLAFDDSRRSVRSLHLATARHELKQLRLHIRPIRF